MSYFLVSMGALPNPQKPQQMNDISKPTSSQRHHKKTWPSCDEKRLALLQSSCSSFSVEGV